jgi:histidinol-phosphate aminotransferase
LKKNNILHPKRGVDSIKLYKGGVSKVQGIEKIIKLSSNESPFGPSQKAQEAYQKVSDKLSRYPELTAESLQNAIANKHNLKSDQIICGTGSDEVLIFTVLTFCSPGDEVIHAQHGFEMYPILAKYAGAESVLASEIDYKVSIDSIINNINDSTKVIFIANPNNPTGTYLNKNELRLLMSKIPSNIVVVIDTAYAEFADADDYDKTFSLADEYNNVLITRTFSKAYSLAGLRLGWGYASDLLINMIKKLRPPFNISPGAIAAGIEALNDESHLEKSVNHNSSIKFWFIDELNNLGFKAYNTQANFIFVLIPDKKNQNAKLISDYLLSKGIAVRYLLSYGLENALRITLGTKEELNKTIEVLKEFTRNNG